MSTPARRLPWWGRLESRVIAALVLIGTLCVGSSAYLVQLTVAYFDGRWGDALARAHEGTAHAGEFHRQLVAAKIGEYQARTRADALELALGDRERDGLDDRARLDAMLAAQPDLVGLSLVRPGGGATEVDRSEEFPEDRFEWFDVTAPLSIRASEDRGQLRAIYRIDPEIDARYQDVGVRRREIDRERRDTQEVESAVIRVIGIASVLVLLVALTLGLLLARTITRKLGQLSGVMTRVAGGQLEARAGVHGNDEIARLAAAFNRMLDELAHAQLRVAYLQRIGAWQEMARRIAHEIKNPLTPIQLAVQQLRDKDPGLSPAFTRTLRSAVEIVEDEIEALRRMVTSFSQFAKVPEVRTAAVELARVIEEFERAYGHLTERADDVLVVVAPEPAVIVLADRQLLKQVLVNLVENAVLSAREAGRDPVRVELTVGVAADHVEIRVDDNGPGVPDELRERVFEPYQTTRAQGTGLGLAIVKKVVLDHGGEVWVASSPLGGARFVVRLPRAAAASSSAPERASSSPK
ncbi:MAG: HAMP domain-containing histidine kinase [Deltaproteobacteria bacterium]|nr:HAMP domain-containing histidine kinase [Deltaproteobacteria bacterium]MBK8238259.1 HAMP domain-containing histidine kinase [Deltaproteobacteria bacterium]MBP7292246.1 HAMP domain-containing histidine kinase [Nannocystaceae bacterium]